MRRTKERARIEVYKVAKTYEAIASAFSETRRFPWKVMLDHIGDVSGKLVLDVGCGSGRHLIELAKTASLAVGIDLSQSLVKLAKLQVVRLKLADKVMLVVGDMLFMPFRASSFDVILCIATIHHVPTHELRRRAVSEMLSTMKAGGLILVSAWYRWQKRLIFRLLKGALMKMMGMVFELGDTYIPWRTREGIHMRFYHLFTVREMRRLLDTEHLKIENLRVLKIGRRGWKNVVALATKR